MSRGFPNMFILTGPGSPSVLTNVVMMLEHDVDWVADCVAHLGRQGLARIEASESAQDVWMEHVAELASATLYARHNSWYMGSNVIGKRRMFLAYTGGYAGFAEKAAEVAVDAADTLQGLAAGKRQRIVRATAYVNVRLRLVGTAEENERAARD